jgi:hypothetical protein
MHDRFMMLTPPTPYAVEPLDHSIGDTVSFMGSAFVISLVIDVPLPINPGWPPGRYFALHLREWSQMQHIIVPEAALDQAREMVA